MVEIKNSLRQTKMIIGIAIAVFMLCGMSLSGCGSNDSTNASEQAVQQTQKPVLSFTVTADTWDTATDESLIVVIDGTDNEGNKINEQFKAVPNTKYDTDIKAGVYTLALASANATKGDRQFTAEATPVNFNGDSSVNAVLAVKLDVAATEKIVAKKQAEARSAAAEAEAKAKKESEEKAVAEPTSKKQTDSSVSSKTSSESTATVYIASSGKGKKYHSNPTCSKMKGATSLSENAARTQGYTPCARCW